MVKRVEARTGDLSESRTADAGAGQVEDLAALAREATEQEQGAQREAEQKREVVVAKERDQEQAAQASAADEVASLLILVRTMASPAVEGMGYMKPGQVKEIWSDDVLTTASGPLVAVMERHGMGLGDLMESWGPYAMLFVATALPLTATVRAVKEAKAAKVAADAARTVDAATPTERAAP